MLINAGRNVSISGIVHLPAVGPQAAETLDRVARENAVRVIGTGINSGFVQDVVPILFPGACVSVARVRATRVVDLSPYGESAQAMYGLNLSPEDFADAIQSERITLHRELVHSAGLIANALDISVDRFEEDKMPVIEDGRVAGFRHICWAEPVVELEMQGFIGYRGDAETVVEITGDPDVRIVMSGGVTKRPERIVAARVVNILAWVIGSEPGLRSPAEPPLSLHVPWRG